MRRTYLFGRERAFFGRRKCPPEWGMDSGKKGTLNFRRTSPQKGVPGQGEETFRNWRELFSSLGR